MRPGNLKFLRIAIIFIAAGLLVFFIFYSRTTIFKAGRGFQTIRTGTYSKLSFIGSFLSEIKRNKTLIEENYRLEEENRKLLARLAIQEELKEQNDFLREALDLKAAEPYKMTDANVFNIQSDPEGNYLLINKGTDEGIKKDDVVVTSSGVLIGLVGSVFENYSKVNSVIHGNFKATISVLPGNIPGIARGAMEEGIILDFISQNDEINENDLVVTSGNDIIPAGLILGKITRISADDGNLFKNVRVAPMFKDLNISNILIINK